MTFLYLGSGLDSLNNSGMGEVESASNDGFVRNSTWPAEWAETPAWTAVQDLWLHFYLSTTGGSATSDILELRDGSTVVFKLTRVSGLYRLLYLSAPATYTQIGTDFAITATGYLDLHFVSGASGSATVYYNSVKQIEASASMTFAPDVTSVRFVKSTTIGSRPVAGICVRTEPTVGGRVVQGYMSGAGANTDFIGGFADVDEQVLNEGDYIYSGTANEVETFTYTLTTALDGYIPRAVCVSARAKCGSGGPQNIQLALRSGGTNYFSGTKALDLGYAAVQHIWETNPDTSLPFTNSQLAALQPGVKSIA